MSAGTKVWPELRSRVRLLGPWSKLWLPSILEDQEGYELLVAVPTVAGSIVPVVGRRGDIVTMHWVSARGEADVDCRLVEVAKNELASWQLHALSEPTVQQRREYVRAKVHMPVTVVDASPLGGWVVDLSEGGARLVTVGTTMEAGRRIALQVDIDGQDLVLQGEVLRTWPDKDGYATVAVKFVELHHRDADRIRRLVFGAQVQSPAGRR